MKLTIDEHQSDLNSDVEPEILRLYHQFAVIEEVKNRANRGAEDAKKYVYLCTH